MGKKYILEIEDEPFVQNGKKLWKSKQFASLVFDQNGLDMLTPYSEVNKDDEPECGKKYYSIDTNSNICDFEWCDEPYDYGCLSIGNCFKTFDEANFMVERLKVITELKKYAEKPNSRWSKDSVHYAIAWDCSQMEISVIPYKNIKHGHGIYFSSEIMAKIAINTIGYDRIAKYYLMVKG